MIALSRFLSVLLALVTPVVVCAAPGDWPWWRGPTHDGHAEAGQVVPAEFDASKHAVWVAPIPGRGHGSPIVVGERVYLVTADEGAQTQSLLCYDRKTGDLVWSSEIHRGNFPEKINKKATHASTTPACDGERLYVSFVSDGAAYTTAVSFEGEKIWQTRLTDYVVHQGYGASPLVYEDLLLVCADNKKAGAICGLNRATGKIVWKVSRPKFPNYVSPIVHRLDGRDQLVLSGCEQVISLDPKTGGLLWEMKGSTQETVTSVVTDGERVFVSGGWPKNHVHAVRVEGSGEVVWRNISRVYVPSMLVKDGHLYAVMDGGAAMCWDCRTGERKWKGVLGGTFSASPVMVGDHIHAISETGEYFVFRADPSEFELLGKSQLGEQAFASPAICGNRIYARVVEYENDERKETLYCLAGAKEQAGGPAR